MTNNIIISNDCWGNGYYKRRQIPFITPFIGIFVPPNSFVNLLENFDTITNKLIFLKKNPITAIITDKTEMVFLHYKNITEAQDKWYRRLDRMLDLMHKQNTNQLFKLSMMTTGVYRQYPTSNGLELLERFHKLPFDNKVSFYDRSLGFVFENPHSFIIEESFAPCALSLWNKTNQWPSIRDMIKS